MTRFQQSKKINFFRVFSPIFFSKVHCFKLFSCFFRRFVFLKLIFSTYFSPCWFTPPTPTIFLIFLPFFFSLKFPLEPRASPHCLPRRTMNQTTLAAVLGIGSLESVHWNRVIGISGHWNRVVG